MTSRTAGEGFTVGDLPSEPETELPKIDFSTFVLSLATSGFYHLGLNEPPAGSPPIEKNLPLARQTIDTLELLQEKTEGNLNADEQKLLSSILYELRMGYVKAGESSSAAADEPKEEPPKAKSPKV